MKTVKTLIGGCLACILLTSTAFAQGKIGYVDSQRIFAESKDYADAVAKFEKDIAAWQKQADEMEAEVKELERELETKGLLLTPERREEKQRTLEAKRDAHQQYVAATFGPGGTAERRNAELVRPINQKIMAIIERIAIEEGYDMILDSGAVSIAYAKKSLDITDRVLEEIEKAE